MDLKPETQSLLVHAGPEPKAGGARQLFGQAGRFAAVGVFNTLSGFVTFNLFLLLGTGAIWANVLSVTIGMIVSFAINKRWVFRQKEGSAVKQAAAFFATTMFSMYVLQTGVIVFLLEVWPVPIDACAALLPERLASARNLELVRANLAKIAATAVSLTWNFVTYRWLVFRR